MGWISPIANTAVTLETARVIESRKGEIAGRELDLLIHRTQADVVVMESGQVEIARSACRKFGKGRHPAGLSFGDCCSYALARYSGEPMLLKGKTF